jgi:hypothetical protein
LRGSWRRGGGRRRRGRSRRSKRSWSRGTERRRKREEETNGKVERTLEERYGAGGWEEAEEHKELEKQ